VDCSGDSTGSILLNMTNGTAPYSYNWDNGDTTNGLMNLFAGYYSVTITDANGCHVLHSDTVTSPSPIQLGFQQVLPTCYDSTGSLSVFPSGGTAPYSYNWSNGTTQQIAANLPQGNYVVTVTDANGCEQISTSLFLNAGLPVADFTITITGNVVTFDNNSLNVVNYLWNFGNGDSSAMIEPTAIYQDSSGSYVISLIVSNSCGSDTITGTIVIIASDVNSVIANNVKATIIPNPTQGFFRMEVEDLPIGEWNIEILSLTGQVVQQEIRDIRQANTQIPIQLQDVGAGMYLVKMVNQDGVVILRKLVVNDRE
jgi:PKD repeat protein